MTAPAPGPRPGQDVMIVDGGWTGVIEKVDAELATAWIRFHDHPALVPYALEAIALRPDRNERRRQLARTSKQHLIDVCRSGVANSRGGRTQVWGAHPLEKWTKEEILGTILDIEYPRPADMDPLPLEGLS